MLTELGFSYVKPEIINYKGWEKSYIFKSKKTELIVVPSIARILSFRLNDRSNILWENPEFYGKIYPVENGEYYNYGGSKLWISPQALWNTKWGNWPPHSELDRGPCSHFVEKDGTLVLTGMKNEKAGIRFIRKIRMKNNGEVLIENIMENVSPFPVSWAIWDVVQVYPSGTVAGVLPKDKKDFWGTDNCFTNSDWIFKSDMFLVKHSGTKGKATGYNISLISLHRKR